MPHGLGTQSWKDQTKLKYVGEWNNGVRAGWGYQYWADKSYYEGEWAEDQRNGEGTNNDLKL